MSTINNAINCLRNHSSKDKVNKFSIVIIVVYYYIGLLSYITVPIKSIYYFFTSGSSVAVVIRALMTAMVVFYSLIVVIVNKEKIQWKWLVIFIYILLFTLISTVISPQTYNYIYVSNDNYNVVYWVQASTGFNRLFTMYLSSISDFALAFCFLFILPIVINNKKQVLILLLPVVVIGLAECLYSIVVEKEEYIKLINFANPEYGGYNVNIGASFGNKQDWGSFAAVAFTSAIVSFFFIKNTKWYAVLLKIFVLSASVIFFCFSVASLCKTAIFSELILYMFFIFCPLLFFVRKRCFVLFTFYSLLLTLLFIGIVLFYSIPSFHSSSIAEKIYNVTYNYIIAKVEGGAAAGRTTIWRRLIDNFRTYNLFFGLSKGGVSTYSQVLTIEGQSALHNGIAYFFASYGLLGISTYFVLLLVVIYRVVKLWNVNPFYVFILFGAFGAAITFSLLESEVLIVSGSNPIFIFNVLLCILPQGLLLRVNKERKTINNEVQFA